MTKTVLSHMAHRLTGQPMFRFADQIRSWESTGNNIIHFEIGDPSFGVSRAVKKAICQSIKHGETHYTNPRGISELRSAIANDVYKSYGFKPDDNQVVIAPANALIGYIMQCTCDHDSVVVYPDPGFPTYQSVAQTLDVHTWPKQHDMMVKYFGSGGFISAMSSYRDDIRLMIINSPSNPTGYIMSEEQIFRMFETANRNGIYLLSDEVYSKMIYDKSIKYVSPSIYDHCQENTIILNSFSKYYSMSGFRIGYIVAPKMLADKIALMIETTTSCMPVFIQKAAIAALNDDPRIYEKRLEILQKRRDIIVDGLNSIKGFKCDKPDATFYVYPQSMYGADNLLHVANIACIDGKYFGASNNNHLRFSYGSVNENQIYDALGRMRYRLK